MRDTGIQNRNILQWEKLNKVFQPDLNFFSIFSTYFFMQGKPMQTWLKPAFFQLLWLKLLCKFASLKSVLCTAASQASSCLQHGCLDVHHCLCEFVQQAIDWPIRRHMHTPVPGFLHTLGLQSWDHLHTDTQLYVSEKATKSMKWNCKCLRPPV